MSIELLLGGLIGSIITIVIIKALDMIQKGREHRFSLQKSYFEKKLQAAETVLTKWDHTVSILSSLIGLYERISTKEKELEYELFRMTNESFTSNLQQIAKASNEVSNIILLYFPTEGSAYLNSEAFKRFLDRLSSIKALDISLKFALDFYDKFRGTKHEEDAWSEVERIIKEYQSNLNDLSSILNEAHKEMMNLMEKIREEMKKYEAK